MSDYEIERIEDEDTGIVAVLTYDDDSGSDNPRDWDNCWTILTNESRSIPIDEKLDPEYMGYYECPAGCDNGTNENCIDGIVFETTCNVCDGSGYIDHTVESYVREHYNAHLIVPVYKYEHGLCRYTASDPGDPWDSGCVGVAVISKAKIDEEWGEGYAYEGVLRDGEWLALNYLKGELETYTQWCNGEVYRYTVEAEDGEILDSVCGYYGQDDCEAEMRSSFDNEVADVHKERQKALGEANRVAWKR